MLNVKVLQDITALQEKKRMFVMADLIWIVSLLFCCSCALGQAAPATQDSASSIKASVAAAKWKDGARFERFIIKEKASPEDWSFFKASSFAWKSGLWDYQSALGLKLSSWHWAWRIAWVQACHHPQHLQDKRCQEIFLAAEKDAAVVVRAEVVRAYKELFQGSGSRDIAMRLEQMFQNPHNYRRGRPLFISKQILYALGQVGGAYSQRVIEGLAQSHPELASYYKTFHSSL